MTAQEEDSMSAARLRRPVVVGVDDRATTRVALDWAIDEASRHRVPPILRACQVPPSSRVGPDEDTADRATPAALEDVARAFGLAPLLEVVTETPVAEPSVVLVDASKEASCLVVGARGQGALAGAILGTTSLDIASHADVRSWLCGNFQGRLRHLLRSGRRGWLGSVRRRNRVRVRPGGGKAGALDRRALRLQTSGAPIRR